MPRPDGQPTMHERATQRDQAACAAREAQERQASMKRVRARERERAGKILSHANVKNGTAIQLANFLVTQTDMSAAEACAALDQARAGEPEKIHHAGGYEAGHASAERLLHPIEADRRAKQALNDRAFEAANFGMVVARDNRSDRDKQKSEDFLNIAQRANGKHDEDEDDNNSLKAMGFGASPFDRNAMEAGATSAARLLGRSPPTLAPRPANSPYAHGRPAPATTLPAPDASYAAGAESAKRLLFGSSANKAEIDSDLRQRHAEQQRERASN